MKKTSLNRFAGLAGIISALLFIISIIGMQSFLAFNLEDMHAFTKNMVDAQGMMLLYAWPGLVATLLIFPLVYAFYQLNSHSKLLSKFVFLLTMIGLCFILVGYLFQLALTYFYAPIFQSIESVQQDAFRIVIKSTIGLQDMFWLCGDLFSFLGIAMLLILGVKEHIFPKSLLIMGAIAGTLAAIGSISFIPAFKSVSGLSFLFISGFSIFAIWEIIAGFLLLRLAKNKQKGDKSLIVN